ncbi:MAG: acyltransferase family protein, partial [Oscillospiraceae bacterium]|nr:acyltransferase family protein [Oscillospiraceae bacterium]
MLKVQRSDKQTDERMIRQSNIELLRIIAIIIIIAHHFAVHSGFDFSADTVSLNRLWIRFIRIGGKIGVNIFVLISGYFLVSAQSIKTSKILKLWGQVFFYSIVIFLVFSVSGLQPFSQQELIEHIAPVTYSRWWFASTYFVLYMLSPYINRLLRTFDRKQYISFLLLLMVLWSVIPTITGSLLQSDPLFWFVFLYSLAGYIKLFGIKTDLSSKKLLLISF